MRRIWAMAAAALGATTALAADSVDHGATPSPNIRIVGRFADAQPSGVTVLPDGRVLLSFPRSAQDHGGPRLGLWRDGKVTAWPDEAAQRRFVSPLALTQDGKGRVWMVDEGALAGSKAPPAPHLFGIDVASGRIVADIALKAPVVRPDTHVNDVRIDMTHGSAGTAFMSDMSQKDHPALLAIDLASGTARRLLADDPHLLAEPGFAIEVDGEMHRYSLTDPTYAGGNVDGVTLSADSARLYWTPLSSRRLYSLPTALLANPKTTPAALKAAIRDEGEVGVADGMATGPDGTLYFTDEERHAVIARTPDGGLRMIAHDPRLIAPDSLSLHDGQLWLTVGQWSRLPAFHKGRDMQEKPYLLVTIDLPKGR